VTRKLSVPCAFSCAASSRVLNVRLHASVSSLDVRTETNSVNVIAVTNA
jgi:hypothetical protein